MSKRSGFPTAFKILIGLIFAGAGVASIVLASPDPGGMVVGAGLVGVAVWQLVQAWRDTRSRESQALPFRASAALMDVRPQGAIGYRSAAARSRTAREVYGPLLDSGPLPKLKTKQGQALAVALILAAPHEAIQRLVFSIVWLTFSVGFFVTTLMRGKDGIALFLLLFVGVGLLLLGFALHKLLSRAKLPRVEISEDPVYIGDDLLVHVEQRGPARIRRLQVDVLCREHVTYTVGTDTRTEDHEVWSQELLDEPGESLSFGQRWPHRRRVALPAAAPHSFTSAHNAIGWFVRVRADITGWPDYHELFEFRVLPKPPG